MLRHCQKSHAPCLRIGPNARTESCPDPSPVPGPNTSTCALFLRIERRMKTTGATGNDGGISDTYRFFFPFTGANASTESGSDTKADLCANPGTCIAACSSATPHLTRIIPPWRTIGTVAAAHAGPDACTDACTDACADPRTDSRANTGAIACTDHDPVTIAHRGPFSSPDPHSTRVHAHGR